MWSLIIPCTDTFNQHFQDNHDYHPNHLWRCCTHFSNCELANNCKIQAKLYHDGEDFGEGYCVVIIGKAMTLTISCHKMVITRLSSQWHRFTPTVSTLMWWVVLMQKWCCSNLVQLLWCCCDVGMSENKKVPSCDHFGNPTQCIAMVDPLSLFKHGTQVDFSVHFTFFSHLQFVWSKSFISEVSQYPIMMTGDLYTQRCILASKRAGHSWSR